jgi:hypothetical protein
VSFCFFEKVYDGMAFTAADVGIGDIAMSLCAVCGNFYTFTYAKETGFDFTGQDHIGARIRTDNTGNGTGFTILLRPIRIA